MTRSNAGDIGKMLKTKGGKFFPATTITTDLQVPPLSVKSIDGHTFDLFNQCRNHSVTLLTVCGSAFAEEQLESFRKPYLDFCRKSVSPIASLVPQLIDVRPIMTRAKWWLFSALLRRGSTQTIPVELQKTFLVLFQPIELLDRLEVPNYLGSFVYLIDWMGRVRWQASGQATEEELQEMYRLIDKLRQEDNNHNINKQ